MPLTPPPSKTASHFNGLSGIDRSSKAQPGESRLALRLPGPGHPSTKLDVKAASDSGQCLNRKEVRLAGAEPAAIDSATIAPRGRRPPGSATVRRLTPIST